MIITDGVHVTSTKDLAELHAWAKQKGIKRHWFHNRRGSHHPHYDLPMHMRTPEAITLMAGVKEVSTREIVEASLGIWMLDRSTFG